MSTDLDVHPSTLLMPPIIDRTVQTSLSNHPNRRVTGALVDNNNINNITSSDHHQHQLKSKVDVTEAAAVALKKEAVGQLAAVVVVVDEENPITPTSDENKIPAPRSPPPAPRKRRCAVDVACRKKLDFLEQQPQLIIPKEEELQEFFNSSFDQLQSRRLLKRRCPCV